MASMSIRCGSNCSLPNRFFGNNRNAWPCCLTVRNQTGSSIGQIGKVSATMEKTPSMSIFDMIEGEHCRRRGKEETAITCEKLDEWMRQSVLEIVNNLHEAPLLVHVYGKDNAMILQTKKRTREEDWAVAKGKWKTGKAPLPEGVIFVEELVGDSREENPQYNEEDGVTKIWGIVIQGKGVESGPICYLLKTTSVRVRLGVGCGMGCSHYCLMRVKDFRETAESQLRNCWLVDAQQQAGWY